MIQVCASCGELSEVIDEICNDCADALLRIFTAVMNCEHNTDWEYHTCPIVDEYGNEGSIDEWTCSLCGEVMEEQRNS